MNDRDDRAEKEPRSRVEALGMAINLLKDLMRRERVGRERVVLYPGSLEEEKMIDVSLYAMRAAVRTLVRNGSTYKEEGAELWKPPLGRRLSPIELDLREEIELLREQYGELESAVICSIPRWILTSIDRLRFSHREIRARLEEDRAGRGDPSARSLVDATIVYPSHLIGPGKFYPCVCPACGWRGLSRDAVCTCNGEDWNDPQCPRCLTDLEDDPLALADESTTVGLVEEIMRRIPTSYDRKLHEALDRLMMESRAADERRIKKDF